MNKAVTASGLTECGKLHNTEEARKAWVKNEGEPLEARPHCLPVRGGHTR